MRMLRRKTEVKAQGFTLKAAMRNSVVSDSLGYRDGLNYMVSDLISSVFVDDREATKKDAFMVCRTYLNLVKFKANQCNNDSPPSKLTPLLGSLTCE